MYHSIERKGKYWQCGVWVHSLEDATKYPSEQEAWGVIAMRNFNNACVVANDTNWRNLAPESE